MNWFKRSLRAFARPISQAPRRHRPEFECLEDRSVPTAAGIISGSVFYDLNGDGVQGANDRSVGGVAVSLTGTTNLGTAVNLSTTTTSAGGYQFIKLEPGQYQVSASNSAFPTTTGTPGILGGAASGSTVQSIVLDQGQVEANLRFAFSGVTLGTKDISLRLFFNDVIGDPATGTPSTILKTATDTAINNVGPAGSGRVVADGAAVTSTTGTGSLAGTVQFGGNGVAGIQVQLTGVASAGTPFVFSTTTDSSGNYKFSNLATGAFFINVLPSAGFRAAGSTVGSLGGSSVRADQLAPTILGTGATGTGYNFNLAAFSGTLDAGLADDAAGGSMGTSSDGITNDPTIRGRLLNASSFASLEARFSAGAVTDFVSVESSIAADGSFVLNPQTLRDIVGGGFPDGAYTVDLRATAADGTVFTKSVSFKLVTNAPTFLSAFPNMSVTNGSSATVLLAGAFTDSDITNSVVTFNIMKGNTAETVGFELYDRDTPGTVANFFSYFTRYQGTGGGTVFHRLHKETGLEVLQGGGNNFDTAGTGSINSTHITTFPATRNEFSTDRPNTLGTIAMAKTSDPDSATSEFFFNLNDANAKTLSVGNAGGFTVFGKALSDADIATLTDLATSATPQNAGGFGELPLLSGTAVNTGNVERFTSISTVFRDSELTYSLTSSNAGVVTVTPDGFQGNRPTIVFVGAGTSTMTVTATDSTGQTATTTFVITVT